MKTLIDKLAAGVSTYEMPDAEVLENRIAVELETGDYKRGVRIWSRDRSATEQ